VKNCIKIRGFLTKLYAKISWLLFMAHGVVGYRPTEVSCMTDDL